MRKHLLLILMLTALFPWSLRAQTLTINDGTVTNQYIPVYGYYADMSSYAETQFILPSEDLTAMVGSDITSLTFYANYSQDFGNASWDIYMQETNSTTLSSIASYSGNTRVYSGHLAVVSNQLVIEFDASYPYNGNNLLITFHKTQSGTCSSTSSNSFYGVSATSGASAYYSYSFAPQPFLPKVTFTYGAPPTCPKPTELAVSDITSAGATLSWTSSASNFVVAYGTGTDPDQMTTVNAATNSIALTGLNANTVYNAYVKAVCSETDESEYSNSATFTTLCEAVATFPYVENFDGLTTNGQIPNCWNNDEGTTTTATYKWSYDSSYGTGVTGKCIRFDSYNNSSGNTNFLKSPVLALPAGQIMMLSFQWKNPAGGDFSVYISTDGGQTHTTALATGLTAQSSWKSEEISLAAYTGQNVVIVFKGTSNWGNGDARIYLDDVTVYEAPSCLKPTDVAVANITNTSAEISWVAGGTETAWNIQYRVAGGENEWVTINNVTANPYTLTGLTAATNYEVQIQSACSATDQSEWTNSVSFTTSICANEDQCQIMIVMEDEYGDGWNGNSKVYFVESTTNIVAGYAKLEGSGDDDTFIDTAYVNVCNGLTYNIMWQTGSYDTEDSFTIYGVAGDVIFSSPASLSAGQLGSFTASCTIPNCMPVQNVAVNNITKNTAVVTWSLLDATESNFVVAYGTGIDPTTMATVNATTNSATLTGLTAGTYYNVFVKAVCSATDESDWSPMATFMTACDDVTITKNNPFTENFDSFTGSSSYSANNLPDCWNYVNTSTNSSYYNYPIVYNSSSYSADNCIQFCHYYGYSSALSEDQYLVLPEVRNDASTLMLQLYAKTSGTTTAYVRSFTVGVMDDPTNASTFTAVETVSNLTTNYAQYESYLNGYEGSGKYVAIKVAKPVSGYYTYSYVYVDDIKLKLIPSCFPVASVSFADVERTSMTINWTKNSNPAAVNTDYQVVLSTTQLDADGLAAAHPVDVLNATTYTATNLERNTLYYVYVRSVCSGDDYSEWVEATQRTLGLMVCDNTIGDGTIEAGGVPVYSSYGNTYSQQIFTAEELTAAGIVAGNITGISYDWNGVGSYQKMLSIYIGSTSKSSFSSASDWVPGSALQLGYGPAVHESTTSGKVDYPFSTPFNWDGTSNIVIATIVNQHNGSTGGSGFTAKGTTATDMAIYKYKDSYPYSYDPSETTDYTGNSKAGYRANISFCQDMPACPEITGLQVVNNGVDEVEFGWTASTGDYVGVYEVFNYRAEAPDYGPLADVDGYYETLQHDDVQVVTGTSVTVSHLDENTVYYLYVRALCNANAHDDGMSGWVSIQYRTLADCLAPVDLVATVNGKKDVTVTWTNGSYDATEERSEQESNFYWILATDDITEGGNLEIDINHPAQVAQNFEGELEGAITDDHAQITFSEAEINLLDHNQTYYFYVRNDCGGSGAWVSTTFTTPDECPAVVNLAVSNQTAHTALLTWDKGEYGDETEWKVAWGSNEFYTTEQSFLVYGLAAETTTTVSVYAACDKNHGVFGTAATVEVTTTAEGGNLVQVGNGTLTTSYHFPISAYYHNSYTQQLYTATEIGKSSGTITSILFNYFWSTTTTRKITVYMGNTETANLSSGYISTNEMTEVFSAQAFTFTNTNDNWCEIELETPFNYTGGNIVVAVYMDYNSCETQYNDTRRFYYTSSASDMARYCTSDTKTAGAISFTNGVPSSSAGTAVSYRPNIKLTFEAVACPKVTTFNVDDITTTTANVSWMPAGGEMTWNYVVSTSATLDADALDAHADASVIAHAEDYAQRFVELNGLTPDTQYYLYVQTICDAETVSAWSLPYEFVTVATCVAPSALLVNNITNESAELAWTENGTATAWQVDYSTDGETWTTENASTNPYTLTGLTGNTYYYVKVRSYCSAEDQSVYTAVANFTTECDALVIGTSGYTEDFESYDAVSYYYTQGTMPDCWSSIFTGTSTSYNVKTSSYGSYALGSGNYILITVGTYSSYGTANYAILPSISNDYDNLKISFDYKMSSSSTGSTVSFGYLTDAADATTFTAIGSALTNSTSNVSKEITLDGYNVPSGACLAFKAYATTSYSFNFSFDNLNIIDTTIVVYAPTALSVSDIGSSGATVSWTAGSTEEKWQYVYGESGFTPDWTNPSEVTATTCTLTGLNSSTDYDVYVRSWYDAETISEPVMISFTTLCEALDLPYSENFESYSSSATGYAVAGIMPNCWDYIFSGTNPIYAPHISASYAPTTTGIVLTSGSVTYGSDNYVILPAFNGVQTSKISYSYMMESSISTNGTLYFGYITDVTDASTFVSLNQLTNYQSKTVVSDYVVAGIPANARLAFKWHLSSSFYCVSIDDISVSSVDVFDTDGNIATAANWSGAEVPATTGYIAAEATVSTDFTIADLNILEGGKVTVNSGATLTVTGTLTNSDAANIVIEDGGQLVNASATKATIQKEIEAYASASGTDADGWYLIASPVTDAAASMVTTGTYDFYTHDEAAYMWRNYKVEANQTAYSWLTNGYGYLYANAVSQTLNFAGTVAADGEKEIALAYTSTGDNTGWNLLGNHTAHNVTIESDFDLLSVKVMDINGIDYTDKLVSTDTFAPCEGFFVQATEAGQHVTINPDMVRSQNAPQGFIRLNLVDNNTPVFTDVAYITMEGGIGSENITFSEVAPQLYVPIDGVDYSVAAVGAEQTIIPVSFKATANSMYTISLNLINAHFETVILRDLKTGINTDLKNGDYVFSGNIDDAENRFNLILAVEAPEGIEEDNAPFAYQSGSDIIFTDTYGTVQVMDVLGRVMSETRIDGDARISTRGFVSGTYVLRLLGSESVRTQKIVVK